MNSCHRWRRRVYLPLGLSFGTDAGTGDGVGLLPELPLAFASFFWSCRLVLFPPATPSSSASEIFSISRLFMVRSSLATSGLLIHLEELPRNTPRNSSSTPLIRIHGVAGPTILFTGNSLLLARNVLSSEDPGPGLRPFSSPSRVSPTSTTRSRRNRTGLTVEEPVPNPLALSIAWCLPPPRRHGSHR